jgi:NAD(P)-dependent dehydrogenase (short-subunit alcohol dehydrogenase family)
VTSSAADRVAIVTGATGALGRLVTGDLAGAGMRVGIVGSRMEEIVAAIRDLCTDEAGIVSGARIPLYGG